MDLPWKAPTVEIYHRPPVAIRASFRPSPPPRAAVGEEAVLQLPGGDVRHGLGQVAPQGVQQFLGVEGLMVQLGFHHVQNLRVSVAAGVDAEAAQAVNKLFPIEP